MSGIMVATLMKFTFTKRFAVWFTALSISGISVSGYVEYECLHTAKDVFRFFPPSGSVYRVKSPHWLFNRYEKFLLSDADVGIIKPPPSKDDPLGIEPPEVYDILAFNPQKFLLLCVASSAVIWSLCLSSSWVLKGFKERK